MCSTRFQYGDHLMYLWPSNCIATTYVQLLCKKLEVVWRGNVAEIKDNMIAINDQTYVQLMMIREVLTILWVFFWYLFHKRQSIVRLTDHLPFVRSSDFFQEDEQVPQLYRPTCLVRYNMMVCFAI